MASIVRRKDGRAEIRESYSTPNGPRSRTLAIFRELTDADLDKAARRAVRAFDREKLLERARALGVPRFGDSASRSARALLAELQQGRPLAPSLVTALNQALSGLPANDAARSELLRWFAATDAERGETLRESVRAIARHGRGLPQAASYSPLGDDFKLPSDGLPPIGAPPDKLRDPPLADWLPATREAKAAPPDDDLANLTRALVRARIPHAWGDAIAYSYYARPLAPRLLELHVFRRPDARAGVLAELARAGVGVAPATRPREVGRGVWLRWNSCFIALRLLEDRHQEVCRRRAHEVPFGEDSLWILSAEDLLIRTVGCATSWSLRTPRRPIQELVARREERARLRGVGQEVEPQSLEQTGAGVSRSLGAQAREALGQSSSSSTREQVERMYKEAAANAWIEMTKDLLFARAGELDVGDVRRWLERLIPDPNDRRRTKFEEAALEILGNGSLAEGARA